MIVGEILYDAVKPYGLSLLYDVVPDIPYMVSYCLDVTCICFWFVGLGHLVSTVVCPGTPNTIGSFWIWPGPNLANVCWALLDNGCY